MVIRIGPDANTKQTAPKSRRSTYLVRQPSFIFKYRGGTGPDPCKQAKQDVPPSFNFDEAMEDIEQADTPITPRRSSMIAS